MCHERLECRKFEVGAPQYYSSTADSQLALFALATPTDLSSFSYRLCYLFNTRDNFLQTHWMTFDMANLQRVVISLLLIITAGFLFLAQTSNAAKGPKITNKVDSNIKILPLD